jgi:predicted nucleic acid-binding protein
MSNSPSNVFLVLNEVLQDIEVDQVQESKTMQKMRVITAERAEVQGQIHEKLKKKGVRFDTTVVKSESSFAVTEIPIDDSEGKYKIRLIYKKKGGGGGSGAGAALTKLSESAQCMYAALAWKNNGRITNADVTCENFNDSKVVSRGSNYVISIDESDRIFRTWLKDLIERNDIKFFDFTPAGEMGTDKLANYMKKLTPGEFIRKINKKDKDA